MDMVTPSEGFLYCHLSWSLAQAHQQCSMGLSQSFPHMRGGNARPRTVFHFNVQKRPEPESSGASLAKRPHLGNRIEAGQGSRKSTGCSVSVSSVNARKKGGCGGHPFLLSCRLVCFPIFGSVEELYFQQVCA